MATKKDLRTKAIPKHVVLRDVYRHYPEFKDHVSRTGQHVIDHAYYIYDDDGNVVDKKRVTISFYDLQHGINELAPRKRMAFFYNVILDMKQREVADIMKITPVSVGQYVEQACMQLAKRYFADEDE